MWPCPAVCPELALTCQALCCCWWQRHPSLCRVPVLGESRDQALPWHVSSHTLPCGSASDASPGSPGTKGIPGSREVGHKCCDGSQAHTVTRMPFLSPRMTSLLAGSWSQAQCGTEHPGPVCMGTCVAHGFPGHRWDCAPAQLCSTTGASPGYHQDIAGTSLPCSLAAQPHWNQQHVVRMRPALGTVSGTRQTLHSVQSFGHAWLRWPG